MDLQLKGKCALVTGGSEGIGKAIAMTLAKEGVNVAICARRMEPLEKTAEEIRNAYRRCSSNSWAMCAACATRCQSWSSRVVAAWSI
jgi:short-subunit dehydrogenase